MRLLKEIQNLMGNYHIKSGIYHYYRSEYAPAVEFLRKALKDEETLSDLERRNARYYLTLSLLDSARRLQEKGEYEPALQQLAHAAEVSPDYPDIHFRTGQLLESLERSDPAVEAYRKAIARHGDYLEARVTLAFCLLRLGRSEEAATAFREALVVRIKKMQEPFDRGLEQLAAGATDGAVEQFHQVFLALPQLARECLRRALDRMKDEDFELALDELDEALRRSPKYPDVHNFRGVVLCELDRIDEALESFRLSAALSPQYLVPRLNHAFALVRAGEYKQAESELEQILEMEPDEPAAAAKLEELRSGRVPEKRRPVSRSGGQ